MNTVKDKMPLTVLPKEKNIHAIDCLYPFLVFYKDTFYSSFTLKVSLSVASHLRIV